jgi:cytochrome c oxidase subunit II
MGRADAGRFVGAAGLAVLVLGACRGPQSALDPRGPQAERLFDMTLVLTVGSAAVFVVVVALTLLAVTLRRREPGDVADAASDEARARRRLVPVAWGAGATLVVLVVLSVHSVIATGAIHARPERAVAVEIVARKWWWEIIYPGATPVRSVRTANELHIPVGVPVEITLDTRDVIHSFWVPNLHGKMDAIPGRKNRLWLQADEPGVFRGQCAEFCGLQHARMAFLVVAEPPEVFARWLEAQSGPARPPADDLARRGQEVFLGASCASCHAIRGTPAMAAAGPDLTHIGSRRTLAAGSLPNRRGQLGGWILDPQHNKPGTFMPPTDDLAADDLHALLHYLESLK